MNRVIVIVFFLLSFLFSACASFFAPFELPMGQQTTRLPLITSQTPVSELLDNVISENVPNEKHSLLTLAKELFPQ